MMSLSKVEYKRELVTDAQITPDEDTRQECRNVGSSTVSSLSYVH